MKHEQPKSFLWLSAALLLGALTAGPLARAQGEGYFNPPEVMQGLPLDKAGAKGWRGQVNKIEPLGGLAYPGETVSLELALTNTGKEPLKVTPTLEVTRFASRLIALKDWFKPDFTNDFVGKPTRFKLAEAEIPPGKSVTIPFQAKVGEFADFGAYALILDLPDLGRQGVGTFVRLHAPNPAQGDGRKSPLIVSWTYHLEELPYMARIGYKWVRTDGSPSWGGVTGDVNKPFDWSRNDAWVDAFRQNKLWILSNLYAGPPNSYSEANRKAYNFVWDEKYDGQWGDFVEETTRRYCGPDGNGPLQVVDLWNEPWDGGGISAWKSDNRRYREIYTILYNRGKKGSPHVLIGGTSSIMNTCDKLLTIKDWRKQYGIDVYTDHYVQPHMMHGQRIAAQFGAFSIDTETWCGKLDEQQMALAAHFIAAGQKKVTPTHFSSQLPWTNGPGGPMFGNLAAAANFLMYFTAGREFSRAVFLDHLPWLYQWGEGKDAVFILSGDHTRLNNERPILYSQICANGTITVNSLGGKLKAYDLYGNLYPATKGQYTLPCGFRNVYLEAPGEDPQTVIAAVQAGKMTGIRPVELFLDDFTTPLPQARTIDAEIHNVLNRPIKGTLTVVVSPNLALTAAAIDVELPPGATRRVTFTIAKAEPNPANAYPVKLRFESADGEAEISDVLHVNTIVHGTPVVDGNLDEWKNVPPMICFGHDAKGDFVQAAWRPWEQAQDIPQGMAEVRFMWDDRFFYVAVRERNTNWKPKPRLSTRNEAEFYGTTPDMLRTFVKSAGDTEPYTGNCVQLGIGLGDDLRGLPPYTKVPAKMIAVDDTAYEYAFWAAPDGGVELWRSSAPYLFPCNFLPRAMPEGYDGVPKGAKSAFKREGNDTVYEMAIPLADMPELKPVAGAIIHLAFALPGSGIQAGQGRSRPRYNGLTLHATWNWDKYSNDLRWGFVKE